MRSLFLVLQLLLFSCQQHQEPLSGTPLVHLLRGVTTTLDTFGSNVEMIYEFSIQVENGCEDIWIPATSPSAERYAHTIEEITKSIEPDSTMTLGGIIDRLSDMYKLEANKTKDFSVAVSDSYQISITPDTITIYFRYYRDSIMFDQWQSKISVPIKTQLAQ